MSYDIKSIKKKFAERGVFYTDTKLAEILKNLITIDYDSVYDPTCGDGALLSVFPDEIKKYGQEIDPTQLDIATGRLSNFYGFAGDTLVNPAFKGKKFKAIVANPPFSIKWNPDPSDDRFDIAPAVAPPSKADYAFILHILHYLAIGGQAIVLNFPGVLYRGNAEGKIRRWLVEQNVISKIIYVEGNYFVDTKISTVIIVFDKGKKTTDIEFSELQSGRSRLVSIQEIEANDFILSVSSYLIEETLDKPPVNPIDLELEARRKCLLRIRKELEFSKAVCDIEGWNIHPFITDIKNAVRKFENDCMSNNGKQLKLYK